MYRNGNVTNLMWWDDGWGTIDKCSWLHDETGSIWEELWKFNNEYKKEIDALKKTVGDQQKQIGILIRLAFPNADVVNDLMNP